MFSLIRRILYLSIVSFFLLSFMGVNYSFAKETPEATVIETNIGIQPFDYKRMISTKEENCYKVSVSTDSGTEHTGKIHIRGSASKEMGFATQMKRLPIELSFEQGMFFSTEISNTCVKFNNVIVPSQLLAEYIAYDLFEFLGIPTPAHSFSFISYNDVDFGLFFVLEDINEEFLEKHFSNPFGSLYKGADKSYDQPYSYSAFFGGLSAKIDHGSERILALLDALNCGEGYEKYLDVDEVLRFFACTAAYGGENSILTELTSYYLYDNNGKFVLLPWDNSEAFQASDTKNGIDHFRLEFWEDAPPSVLFDLLMQKEENKKLYHLYLNEINENFLKPEILDPYFQSLASLVSPYLLRDPTIFFNTPYGLPVAPEEGVGTIGSLLLTLHEVYENLSAQLNGSADVFYINQAHEAIPPTEEFQEMIAYIMDHSPGVNLNITDAICVGYTAYCRSRGINHFATGDPAEFLFAAFFFAVTVFVLILYIRVISAKKKLTQKKKTWGENRRC